MNDTNVVVTETRGHPAEVYISDIYQLFDEYVETLGNPEDIKDGMAFQGAMMYIYERLFAHNQGNDAEYRKNAYQNAQKSILPYDDIKLMDKIFMTYCGLCYRYDQIPTLLEYGILTGVAKETLNDWINGTTRKNTHMQTAKKWKATCEAALAKKAIGQNGVGAIFALKCAHGWRETSPVPAPDNSKIGVIDTPDAIMARHAGAVLPEPLDEV